MQGLMYWLPNIKSAFENSSSLFVICLHIVLNSAMKVETCIHSQSKCTIVSSSCWQKEHLLSLTIPIVL